MRHQERQGALTQMRTLWGGGALEVGDHRLLEDGSERGGALVSDVVAYETASEGRSGTGDLACQRALTQKRRHGAAAHPRLSILVSGRIFTSMSRPDISLPQLVRLLPAKLRGARRTRWETMAVNGADTEANT